METTLNSGLTGLAALAALSLSTTPLSLLAQEADPGDSQVMTLSPFTVTEEGGYRASNSISGTLINTPVRDLPLTLEVVTEDFIDDIAAFDLQESLRYTAGVTTNGDTGGRIRGFNMLWNQRNGFRRYDYGDAVNIQRVEVIKGPAALLYGLTRPGGIVNYITKRPLTGSSFGEVKVTAGSENFIRSEIDGNISVDDKLAIRVLASRTETDVAINHADREITFLAPSILYRPWEHTTIIFEAEFLERDRVPFVGERVRSIGNAFDNGEPLYADEVFPSVSFDERFAHPDELQRNEADTYFLTIEHEFNENLQLRFNSYIIDRTDREISTSRRGFMTSIGAERDENGELILDQNGDRVPFLRRHWADDRSLNDWTSFQLDLAYTFETGPINHRFVGGYYWSEDINNRLLFEDRDFIVIEDPSNPGVAPEGFRANPVGGPGTGRPLGWLGNDRKLHITPVDDLSDLSINNPFNDRPTFQFPWLEYEDDIDDTAIYLTYFGRMFNDQLIVMGGFRYQESSKTRASVGAVGAELPWEDDYLAPQFGFIYNLRPELGFYAMYSESFDPQNGQSNSFLEQFDPLVGESTELGIKGDLELMGGLYSYSLAYFDVDETNRIFTDPDIPNAGGGTGDRVAAGLVTSRGVDLSITANPTPNWSTVFSLSYINVEEQEPNERVLDNFEGVGLTWSVWTSYEFTEAALAGLELGGGAVYTDNWDGFGGRVFGDYYLVDLRAGYNFAITDAVLANVALNVRNVTDQRDQGGNGGWLDPRLFFVSGTLSF